MKFCYTYDNMERLLTATVERDGTGPVLLCGNTLDELSLSHDGNQLRRVTDQCAGLAYEGAMDFRDGADRAEEYTYDACGNMTSDRNKGITGISYNVLNLPEEVRFADGHVTRYTWDAAGRKLRVEYLLNSMAALEPVVGPPGTIARVQGAGLAMPGDDGEKTDVPAYVTLLVRDYCAGHVYRGGRLERMLNEVGYSDSAGYHYYVRDYRGDVRAVVADDGTLEEVNHYYPYGMLHGPSAIAAGVQPHKYTGKELDREAGLDLYDFAARQLDPALGRTTTQDPMAEKYYSISPYTWCAGNPIKHIDLTGKESINGINMNEKNAKNVIPGLLNKYQNTNKIVVFSHGNETGTALVYSVKKWRVKCLYILKITFLQLRVLKNTSSLLQKYGGQRKKQNTKVWLSCLIHVMWEDQMVLPRKCQRHFLE